MEFVAELNKGLPPRAWCLQIRRGDPAATLSHGEYVEVGEDRFVEGVWDGPFARRGFLDAPVLIGSGGQVRNGRVELTSQSDVFGRLTVVRVRDGLWASNSSAFAMVRGGLRPDPLWTGYHLMGGRFCANGPAPDGLELPATGGGQVRVYLQARLTIDSALGVSGSGRPPSATEPRYDAYRELLGGSVGRLVENATDPERSHRFEPVALVSRGYDSPAGAALAAEAGCRTAVTLVPDREDGGIDDGTPIAEILGMTTHRVDPCAWRDGHECPEVDFVSFVTGATLARLGGAERHLAGRLVLGGSPGDSVWGGDPTDLHDRYRLVSPRRGSLQGLTEFELRTGSVIAHVPLIGAADAGAINAITHSPELEPWSVPGPYDRPIPSRILAEAGVPRELFGQRKMASSGVPLTDELTPASAAALEAYLQSIEEIAGCARARRGVEARRRAKSVAYGLYRRLPIGSVVRHYQPMRLRLADASHIDWRLAHLHHWAFEELAKRYQPSETAPHF